MEYLIFAIVAVGFVVIIMIFGWFREQAEQRKFIGRLRTDYGILPRREYIAEQYGNIACYYRSHQTGIVIDDITWNDLEMDELFRRMNYTYSSAGEEYLYYLLRSPATDKGELDRREAIITYFQENEDPRVAWQFLMAKLGRTGKYSIYNYLDYLDELGTRNNLRHYLSIIAFFVAIAAFFGSVTIGITLLFGVLSYNLMTYFKIKKEIDPYITSFSYIFRLLHCIRDMEKHPIPILKEELAEMIRCKNAFRKFRRGSSLLMSPSRMNASGNPLELLMDYLRMGFHLDLIKFNQMLSEVNRHKAAIDRILTVAGSIEALIAIGAWRAGLARKGQGFAIPEFTVEQAVMTQNIVASGLYHPFLTDPVKNNLRVNRSILLTGSNASGKSTFLKTVALNAILAQTIHTCTASSYKTGFFHIATSMSLRDDILKGDSYYMAEIKSMKRLTDMAKEARFPVLILVDEVLRGTNTVERIAASTQILRNLGGKNRLCFAATHDIELTYLLEKEYDNYHFEEEFREGDIYFPYLLKNGRATTRNAIKLLRVMGYDERLVTDAERLAERFLVSGRWEDKTGNISKVSKDAT
ncbi:MAG: hypothetical protein LBV33_08305 [Lachnospiraceae bacterium]|jgi:DNA mismatch repair ATPase MutS|nr:hypothetical protein [Lachnospiraceae bacterium]